MRGATRLVRSQDCQCVSPAEQALAVLAADLGHHAIDLGRENRIDILNPVLEDHADAALLDTFGEHVSARSGTVVGGGHRNLVEGGAVFDEDVDDVGRRNKGRAHRGPHAATR
ncbi:hypothetical protein [Ralstonia syzygii]|uniref:hypothetical protein n=1 Tax=Ralstonia syzygii TaxID=28097 RepID=UPI003516529A